MIVVLLLFVTLLPAAIAHETSGGQEAFVRVVSADAATNTYTFACVMNNTFLRDWAIRMDTGDVADDPGNEAEINDLAHDEYLTYTFETDSYYHVGCQVVSEPDFDEIWRGDLHLDLRPDKTSWDPQIVPAGGDGLTATLECRYSGSGTPSWEVLNARTGERTALGNADPLVHTVDGHGLYDYFCTIDGKTTGYPVEFFDDHDPYYADEQGVPLGVTGSWNETGGEEPSEPVCGNGVIETGETCDDGNTLSGDGCSSTCQEESSGEQACFSALKDLPVSCEGGSITADTFNGCRTVACSGASGSLQVLACEKPNTGTKTHFEIYKQSGSGEVSICFADVCLPASHGYKKSTNYPICTDTTTDPGEEPTEPVCGNDVVETGETCDDGNTLSGDGCSSTCQTETSGPVCGDGVVQTGETCDDGNTLSGDGCSSTCQEESTGGEVCAVSVHDITPDCSAGSLTQDVAMGSCRQLTCTSGEQQITTLGCNKPDTGTKTHFELYKQSATSNAPVLCLGETCVGPGGYAKSPAFPICTDDPGSGAVCGNGILEGAEACDDGNLQNGDGCSSTCQEESTGGEEPVCGNGVVETGETCDDGNTANNDGCSSTCQTESSAACHESIEFLPVSCPGTITQDTYTGCRHITCETASGSTWVLACEKPNTGAPQYFELYKQSTSGVAPEVCLADVCIKDNGYAKSGDYPICIGTSTPGNETSDVLGAPVWIEPTDGLTGVTLDFFHLATTPPENDEQVASSDWEVWDESMTQRVWHATGNTGLITYHTHTPDGVFDAGGSQLDPLTTYNTRVRYQDTSGNYSPWAQWRSFTTRDAQVLNPTSPDWTAKQGYRVEKFASGFDVPVHLAFAPDIYGHLPENERPYLYVTELYGTVKVVYPDGTSSVYADGLLNFDPFGSITGAGQMGLISLYVEPETGDLYVGTVYVEGEDVYNKVIKFTSNGDGDGYSNQETLIDGLPSGPSHQVEQITKGPDGRLYINLGEGLEPANAQNDSILAGKIISMNTDGSDVTTYAKGFRNPFGADWRPGTGQLIVTDNAPDKDDRLVYVEEGKNYGWGLNDNFATFNAERIDTLNVSPVDVEFNPGLAEFSELYVAVAGPIYQQGPTTGKHILEYTLHPDASVATRQVLVEYTGDGYGTPMGLDFGPDGLYFTDIYGEPGFVGLGETEANIFRVVPGEPGNQTEEPGEFRAGISIIAWYPQDAGDGIEYIFECQGIDGSGSYSYAFDLGTGAFSIEGSRQYVKYPYGDADHTVTCLANDLTTADQASASITVNPDHFIAE